MELWHLTPDAPRVPTRASAGERVALGIGTWPIEPAQSVRVAYVVTHADGATEEGEAAAVWSHNAADNSYWRAEFGPFRDGDRIRYALHGASPAGRVPGPVFAFRVGPKLCVALLWHQHQPWYRDGPPDAERGRYRQPWVRLHALRDYYSMAALAATHPGVHLTINLTPALLAQLEDYAERGATDRVLELTLKPAERLTAGEQEEMLGSFFDADWHHQIFPYRRYEALFQRRLAGRAFPAQERRDLAMWFHLAWFGQEFRTGPVELVTGELASVRRFVEQAEGFTHADIEDMVAEQRKVLRAVIPLHRRLQERGQIEVATTPFYHPLLPLLVDTDHATVDRPGAVRPRRFAHPEDAAAQVSRAVECYQRHFGRPPRGMWPAEGAVAQSVVPLFARHGVEWIATDRGVLARSGRYGYDADDPDVLCQLYRAEQDGAALSVFFRDTALSDAIGFRYQHYADPQAAARDFVREIRERFIARLGDDDRILTVVLDGENAWGGYRDDARPFLHALYGALERDAEIATVTFAEYLDGNPVRGIAPHPPARQARVHDLFTGSWIDEWGSAPGVDLGTWIGEDEENRAWDLLGAAHDALAAAGVTTASAPLAFEALYAAEGSDWFWWYGRDQDSGHDSEFDELFRGNLRHTYHAAGLDAPAALDRRIVPAAAVWTFARPVTTIQPGDRLVVRSNCPGVLEWRLDDAPAREAPLVPVGGVMAGTAQHELVLGPFAAPGRVRFRFRCTHPGCDGARACCRGLEQEVTIHGG